MRFDFETAPRRAHLGNLKDMYTPEAMKEAGYLSMNGAEMDFRTAPVIRSAVCGLAENGLFGFTLCGKEYDDAVVWWMKQMRGWNILPEWIVTALGTIFSCATLLRLLVGPEDAMIVQPPVYYRYEQAARRMGKRTVYNRMKVVDGRYEIDFEDLEAKMADPHNKLLILCNPQNPTGRVYTEEELRRIAVLSAKYQVVVYSDEIFAEYTYEGHRAIPYASIEEGRAYAISCTSLGKAFNFTGVNHANLIIPDEKLRKKVECQRTADHYGSIDPMAYVSVVAAYSEEGAEWVSQCREYLDENRRILQRFADAHPEAVTVYPIEGSFVAWMKLKTFVPLSEDPEELTALLREKALVDLGPGTEYDTDARDSVRISFATQHRELEEALKRLGAVIESGVLEQGGKIR